MQISTKWGYHLAGNIRWAIDGRGTRADFAVNSLNQIVEITVASEVSQSSGLVAYGYKSRIYYDHNNNVLQTSVEYRDGNNPDVPEWLTTTYSYDILDKIVESTRIVSAGESITTQLRYDPNENLIESMSPLAVSGTQPGNKVRITYDERDFPYRITSAPGTADEATTTYRRDLNGNAIEVIGPEDNNGDGVGDSTLFVLDGFDRRVKAIDAAGDEVRLSYDPASNVIQSEIWGSVGGPTRSSNSTSGNVLLARGHAYYDELSRLYQREAGLFVPQGVVTTRAPLLSEGDLAQGDGRVTSFLDYDRNSRITFTTQASPANALEVARFYYDGLGRSVKAEDADGNQVLTAFDQNSNAVRVTTIEKHPTGRVPQESFVTINVFDSLNRITRTTNNIGATRRFYHDSRGLLIKATDARGPLTADPLGLFAGMINADGNVTEFVHDGLGRTIRSVRTMTRDGEGGNPIDLPNPANPDGKIIEETFWDENSRAIAVSDDKENATFYEYDNQNRPINTTFADGSTTSTRFDRASNPIRFVDNNGTVVNNTFDVLGRLVRKNIIRAQGVSGTTEQTLEYNGLSMVTSGNDNNDPADPEDDSTVKRQYDSLGRLLEETQNGKAVSYNWTQGADPVDLTYPNGRKITYALDRLNRLTAISANGNPVATYDYLAGRVLERSFANGVKLSMLSDTGTTTEGYDDLGRLTKLRHINGEILVAGFSHDYNRENHKWQNLLCGSDSGAQSRL